MLYSPQREVRREEWSWMAFAKTRRALTLTAEERERLSTLTKSRKASGLTPARARILLGFADRQPLAVIAAVRASGTRGARGRAAARPMHILGRLGSPPPRPGR